jgi:hypothetical protein
MFFLQNVVEAITLYASLVAPVENFQGFIANSKCQDRKKRELNRKIK